MSGIIEKADQESNEWHYFVFDATLNSKLSLITRRGEINKAFTAKIVFCQGCLTSF